MSRYRIPAQDPRLTVIVGWDNPLATFFAQVFEPFLARMSRVCTGECPALLVNYVHTRLSFLMLLDAAHTPRRHFSSSTAPRPLASTRSMSQAPLLVP